MSPTEIAVGKRVEEKVRKSVGSEESGRMFDVTSGEHE